MMDAIPFRTVLNVVKAVEEDGKKYLIGESSGPEVDKDEQFMTKSCVTDMADQINRKPIPYLDEHSKRGVPSQLGEVVEASVTPAYHLLTKTELDVDNPISVMLWKKVKEGKQYGQSVAGNALKYAKKTLTDRVLKGFDQIKLDHIANTTRPSWQHGFGAMIAKSQDWQDIPWDEVEEYEDELPFEVAKRSKPDPKAGEPGRLVNTLRKLLNLLASFDWASYKEYIAVTNRDSIPFSDPDTSGVGGPVGDYADPPRKSYDEEDGAWLEYVEKAQPQTWQIEEVTDIYSRLCVVEKALPEEEKELLLEVGNLLETMRAVLTKPEGTPQVKAYNTEVEPIAKSVAALEDHLEVQAVSQLDGYLAQAEQAGAPILKSFADADAGVGRVETTQLAADLAKIRPVGPAPGETLTDFSQVAQPPEVQPEPMVAKTEAVDPLALLQQYKEEIAKSNAPLAQKQAALARLMEGVQATMMEELTQSASTEDRSAAFVEKSVIPILEKISERLTQLERQLAVSKSTGGEPAAPGTLVRKSIAPEIRPSRNVSQKATFTGLVKGDQYMEVEE